MAHIFGKSSKANKTKEYFKKLQFYTLIGKNVEPLNNSEVTIKEERKILVEKEIIDKKITEKYRRLLRDKGEKRNILKMKINKVISLSKEQVEQIIKYNVKNKAMSWDPMPRKANRKLCRKKAPNGEIIICKITELLNEFLDSKCIPIEISSSRVFVPKKK